MIVAPEPEETAAFGPVLEGVIPQAIRPPHQPPGGDHPLGGPGPGVQHNPHPPAAQNHPHITPTLDPRSGEPVNRDPPPATRGPPTQLPNLPVLLAPGVFRPRRREADPGEPGSGPKSPSGSDPGGKRPGRFGGPLAPRCPPWRPAPTHRRARRSRGPRPPGTFRPIRPSPPRTPPSPARGWPGRRPLRRRRGSSGTRRSSRLAIEVPAKALRDGPTSGVIDGDSHQPGGSLHDRPGPPRVGNSRSGRHTEAVTQRCRHPPDA